MTSVGRKLLILDLDETLIYASENNLGHEADFVIGPYHVYCRPHLESFLATVTSNYDWAVWSSASPDYVTAVVSAISMNAVEPVFVWGRERCTRRYDMELQEEYFEKNLKKVKRLGYDLERILIVEDTPQKVERHYGNAVYVSPYFGDNPNDNELRSLATYLQSISTTPNVRQLEKRGWRQDVK